MQQPLFLPINVLVAVFTISRGSCLQISPAKLEVGWAASRTGIHNAGWHLSYTLIMACGLSYARFSSYMSCVANVPSELRLCSSA